MADKLRAAETFLGGGTNYVTPLKEALRLIEQEGFEKADMVFVTDGDCSMPEQFLSDLKQEQAQKKFQITGVLLDQDAAGFAFSLEPFCTPASSPKTRLRKNFWTSGYERGVLPGRTLP